jgi:hypothetical protein
VCGGVVVVLDVAGGEDAGEVRLLVKARRVVVGVVGVVVVGVVVVLLEGSEAPGLVRLGGDLRGDAAEEGGDVRGEREHRDVLPRADVRGRAGRVAIPEGGGIADGKAVRSSRQPSRPFSPPRPPLVRVGGIVTTG